MNITTDIPDAFEDVEVDVEAAMRVANEWFSKSQEHLYAGGDRHDYDVYPVAQSAQPPQWDRTRGVVQFAYPHEAAVFFEVGTEPHTIEPTDADVLRFPWPNGPNRLTNDDDIAFLPSVDHPGTEPLRFVERARNEVIGQA